MRHFLMGLLALSASACSAEPTAPIERGTTLFSGNVWGGNLAVADGLVYFTTFGEGAAMDHAVWSLAVGGGVRSEVWLGQGDIFGDGMAVDRGYVYWSQGSDAVGGNPGVYRAPIAGGERELLGEFPSFDAPYAGVVTDGANVYAAQLDSVIAVPATGGTVTTLYTGDVGWIALSVDRSTLYIVADAALRRVVLPGGAPEVVAAIPGGGLGGLAVDSTSAFVTTADLVLRMPLDGGTPTTLAAGLVSPSSIVATEEHLYVGVALGDHHAVVRVPIDGGDATYVVELFGAGSARLALDGDALYAAYCCGDGTAGGAVVRVPR